MGGEECFPFFLMEIVNEGWQVKLGWGEGDTAGQTWGSSKGWIAFECGNIGEKGFFVILMILTFYSVFQSYSIFYCKLP